MSPQFHSSLGIELSIPAIVGEIMRFMSNEPSYRYRITIGTDSELLASKEADFVSAIVVHRIGNGGRYFWRRSTIGRFHTLRDRIIREVLISLDLAQELLRALEDASKTASLPEWDFQIHVFKRPHIAN